MNRLQQLLMECELDADALVSKLDAAARLADLHDAHARRRLDDMADWLSDVGDELAALAGHPRETPDYQMETRR